MIRLGKVPFFAAAPFFARLDGHALVTGSPGELVKLACAGDIECTLVSSLDAVALYDEYEPLISPHGTQLGIAAVGAMGSHICFSTLPMERWANGVVAAPPGVTIAITLLDWIARRRGATPSFSPAPNVTPIATLTVGDAALREAARLRSAGLSGHVYDLPEEWRRETQLPFVFFLWVVRRRLPANVRRQLGTDVFDALAQGQRLFAELARDNAAALGLPEENLVKYLAGIVYELGPNEISARETFLRYIAPTHAVT